MHKYFYMLASFLLLSNSVLSNDQVGSLVVNNQYEKIIEKIESKVEKDWKDYFYLSISHYHLNNKNLSYLNSVRSLVTNPYSFNNKSNIEMITLGSDKDPREFETFLTVVMIKLYFLIAITLVFFATIFFFKNLKVRVNLSLLQIILIFSYVAISSIYNPTDPKKLTIQNIQNQNLAMISPSSQSSKNNDISSQEILFRGRSIEDWVFVKNMNGEPAWIKKANIAE